MRFNLLIVTAVLSVLAVSADAFSQMVDPCESEASVSCPGMRLRICPSSDFDRISDICEDGYIEIWVRDRNGYGISNVPPTDYWINACDPAQELCLIVPQPVVADSLTSELPAFRGRTTISGYISGGGCVLTGGLYVAVQGVVIQQLPGCIYLTCLDIVVVSPDINGDCTVSLADFQLFTMSYNKSEGMQGYNDCCDYTGDGNCQLGDFAFFAEHYQH